MVWPGPLGVWAPIHFALQVPRAKAKDSADSGHLEHSRDTAKAGVVLSPWERDVEKAKVSHSHQKVQVSTSFIPRNVTFQKPKAEDSNPNLAANLLKVLPLPGTRRPTLSFPTGDAARAREADCNAKAASELTEAMVASNLQREPITPSLTNPANPPFTGLRTALKWWMTHAPPSVVKLIQQGVSPHWLTPPLPRAANDTRA